MVSLFSDIRKLVSGVGQFSSAIRGNAKPIDNNNHRYILDCSLGLRPCAMQHIAVMKYVMQYVAVLFRDFECDFSCDLDSDLKNVWVIWGWC